MFSAPKLIFMRWKWSCFKNNVYYKVPIEIVHLEHELSAYFYKLMYRLCSQNECWSSKTSHVLLIKFFMWRPTSVVILWSMIRFYEQTTSPDFWTIEMFCSLPAKEKSKWFCLCQFLSPNTEKLNKLNEDRKSGQNLLPLIMEFCWVFTWTVRVHIFWFFLCRFPMNFELKITPWFNVFAQVGQGWFLILNTF